MAASLGTFTCATLGRTETKAGYPFIRFISPTDFDFALENMRVRIRDTSSIWQGFDYLGLFASGLRQWLTAYIETAVRKGKAYKPADLDEWLSTMEKDYPGRFEQDNMEKYFQTLYNLYREGQVGKNIYEPFKYTPEKPDFASTFGVNWDKIFLYGILGLGVLAFASGGYAGLLKRK